jgi:ribulose-5-phosphate 4-epimerase/fuculose-1-phosphate aldolase
MLDTLQDGMERDAAGPGALRERVSPAEWRARVELAAFYRVIHGLGLTDLIYNHVSLRLPDQPDALLINPFGLDYAEITASSLMKIDHHGRVLLQPDHGYGLNPAGVVVHGAIHRARPDLACVAHTHSVAGVAVASLREGLLPLNQNALRFHDDLAYHDYEGPALREDEQARLIASLGGRNNMVLRNHGLIACGRSLAQAYVNLYSLEHACRIQVATLSCGRPIQSVAEAAIAESRAVYRQTQQLGPAPDLEWRAAMRALDRQDPSYRQ